MHDAVCYAVLAIPCPVGHTKDAFRVGFILRKEERNFPFTIEEPFSKFGISRFDYRHLGVSSNLLDGRVLNTWLPGPLVAKPKRGQDAQLGWLPAAIMN